MDDGDGKVAGGGLHPNLPRKSSRRYLKTLLRYHKWKDENNINSDSEATVLMYFKELSSIGITSLWNIYSMLKSTLLTYQNTNISEYRQVKDFLRLKDKQNHSLPSRTLTGEEIDTFLNSAPDDTYLVQKVIIIFQITGNCRTIELNLLKVSDVQLKKDVAEITMNRSKDCISRKFTVADEHYEIVRKYVNKRKNKDIDTNKFFVSFESGKCLNRSIDKEIHKTHRIIAKYLNLPNHENYYDPGVKRIVNNKPVYAIKSTGPAKTVNINIIDGDSTSMTYTQNGNTKLIANVRTCNESDCKIPNIRMTNCRNISFNFSE